MAKQTKYNVRLRGVLPFNSVSVPGQNPSVVVGRDGAVLTKAELDALKEGMGEGALSDLSKDNLQIEKIEEEVDATKGAVRLARKEGLDVKDIEGTGTDGKVTKSDVEDAAK